MLWNICKYTILLMGESLEPWIIKHASVKSISITIIIVALFVNEFLIYWIQSSRWPSFSDRNRNKELVVMLVSDPQLQGLQDEPGFPVGAFSRWDADRFISKTFGLAYSYSQPDVVIFLGDLMDEGSKATPEEYQSYFDRFNSIFAYAKQSEVIYIPGDNDIGGEGRDFRTQAKISRFQQHFGEKGAVVNSKFVDFLKLDSGIYSNVPVVSKETLEKYSTEMDSPFRVIISHESLLPKLKVYIYPILRKIEPQLIFSGHWHKSMIYKCDSCINDNADVGHWPVHRRFLSDIYDFMYIDASNREGIHELMVPTCSYRMGVADMGYGLAIIHKNKSVQYTVLWLPRRYTVLYSYIFVIVFLILLKLSSLKCLPYLQRRTQNFKNS